MTSDQFGQQRCQLVALPGIRRGPNIFRVFDYLGLTEAINRIAFFPAGLALNDAARAAQSNALTQYNERRLAGSQWMYDGIEPSKLFQ